MSKEKFTMDELDVIGTAPAMFPGMPGTPIYNRPISIKENRDLLFSGQRPMWIPSSSDLKMFCPAIIPDNVARGFIVEANRPDPGTFGGKDFFGVEWEFVPEVNGSMVSPGQALPGEHRRLGGEDRLPRPVAVRLGRLRPAQQGLPGGQSHPAVDHERHVRAPDLLSWSSRARPWPSSTRISRSMSTASSAACATFMTSSSATTPSTSTPTASHFHDDWGSQRAPFFSLDTCREMLVPYMKRVVESCHKRGILFDFPLLRPGGAAGPRHDRVRRRQLGRPAHERPQDARGQVRRPLCLRRPRPGDLPRGHRRADRGPGRPVHGRTTPPTAGASS